MRLVFAGVGRARGAERELRDEYVRRIGALGRSRGIMDVTWIDIGPGRAAAPPDEEARILLKRLPCAAYIVALDERGREYDSAAVARSLAHHLDSGTGTLAFAVGGAKGHGAALVRRADARWALSRLTLPHKLAQIIIAEQIYRALTLLCNHPYHKA